MPYKRFNIHAPQHWNPRLTQVQKIIVPREHRLITGLNRMRHGETYTTSDLKRLYWVPRRVMIPSGISVHQMHSTDTQQAQRLCGLYASWLESYYRLWFCYRFGRLSARNEKSFWTSIACCVFPLEFLFLFLTVLPVDNGPLSAGKRVRLLNDRRSTYRWKAERIWTQRSRGNEGLVWEFKTSRGEKGKTETKM